MQNASTPCRPQRQCTIPARVVLDPFRADYLREPCSAVKVHPSFVSAGDVSLNLIPPQDAHLLGRRPRGGVLGQQHGDEVLGVAGDAAPVAVAEVHAVAQDGAQHARDVGAVGRDAVHEREVAGEQLVRLRHHVVRYASRSTEHVRAVGHLAYQVAKSSEQPCKGIFAYHDSRSPDVGRRQQAAPVARLRRQIPVDVHALGLKMSWLRYTDLWEHFAVHCIHLQPFKQAAGCLSSWALSSELVLALGLKHTHAVL